MQRRPAGSSAPPPAARVAVAPEAAALLGRLGVPAAAYRGGRMPIRSPISGEIIAEVDPVERSHALSMIGRAHESFLQWRQVPAPKRGELVRLFAQELRLAKSDLGLLVTLETGKIISEGLGEVQEMIDICDFAVGLSRQLYGLTMATERVHHRMLETWHPLGVTGIISAFNFPVAVWAWNAALAIVCGNACVWKPSERTPLTALATQALFERAMKQFDGAPAALSTVLIGGREIGAILVDDGRIPLVSATGSTAMGHDIAPRLAGRFARALLELGGNNAAIVGASADLDLAVRAIAFSAMGTAGQRCTTLRRLFIHRTIHDSLIARLQRAYASVVVGDPRDAATLVGPLIDEQAFTRMQQALAEIRALGGSVSGGARVDVGAHGHAFYVQPALATMASQVAPMTHETFAPILYAMKYDDFDDAVHLQNAVAHGLSSSIFTTDLREAERFLSSAGSDCGIANVNIGPSGAEIGGAFGGEKDTGGGREAGADCWRAYMRRATNTINFGRDLPLAQGVRFDIE